MNNLIELVTAWGVAKGILKVHVDKRTGGEYYGGNVFAQLKKCAEEVLEATEAGAVWGSMPDGTTEKNVQSELGDIGVTWIMSCRAAGMSPEDCLSTAYQKIQFRTGEMKDGQFVKTEDTRDIPGC